ncbi:uncharacterized protein LOC131882648 [Tigriopus californicus]|uniref:uncharacterized protein LOC131882648 n=1 Tax=Tigriopus californicus TaxID=6832 RepID=UPI0027DA1950|nr:uncharacterized protein LOC131882648 [Tigriopus californicus]
MFKFKLEQCWKLFNLNSHLIKEKNRLMCNEIKKMLIDHGLYSIPKLYFARGLVEIDRKRVRNLANTHQIAINNDKREASYTIHPSVNADNTHIYCRPVFKIGQKYLVHFNGFPARVFKGFYWFASSLLLTFRNHGTTWACCTPWKTRS